MRLTPVEFEIMEIVWEQGSALVKDVHKELYRRKGLAYTTVMTEMMLMSRKGILSHDRRGRAYVYSPRVDRRQVLDDVLKSLVVEFFHGSHEELLRYVNGEGAGAAVAPAPRRERRVAKPAETSSPRAPRIPPPEPEEGESDEDVTLL